MHLFGYGGTIYTPWNLWVQFILSLCHVIPQTPHMIIITRDDFNDHK